MKIKYFLCFLLFNIYLPINAGIIYVPRDEQTIQDGIDSAREADTVLVAPGRYFENINFKGKHITVASYFLLDRQLSHIEETVIDGSRYRDFNKATVVTFSGGENEKSVLSGFTLTGGKGTRVYWKSNSYRLGGGILVAKSGALIEHNKIIDNHLEDFSVEVCGSAGMEVLGSSKVIIRNNEILNNTNQGYICNGAVALWTSDQIIFEGNVIKSNISNGSRQSLGGGLCVLGEVTVLGNLQGDIVLRRNLISNNQCMTNFESSGGGLWIKNISPVLENNLILENSASRGGGVFITHRPSCSGVTHPEFRNNTITANSAVNGGGVFMMYEERNTYDLQVVFHNTVISGNIASTDGKELYTYELGKPADFYYCNIPGGKGVFGGKGGGENFTGVLDNCTFSEADISNKEFCNDHLDSIGICKYFHLAETDIACIDKGDPDFEYNDCTNGDELKPQWPSLGTLRNDIGAYGGKFALAFDKTGAITHTPDIKLPVPYTYDLEQNFPNPFNPVTNIRFRLPESERVVLEVFTILGQRVRILLDGEMTPGEYEIPFDGRDLTSGTYIYRLQAGKHQLVRKMVILR